MSWVERLKGFGVDEATVDEWAAKNYPQYKSNRELMAKLYLVTVKGVKVAEPRVVGEFTTVSELTVGAVSRIQVVVVQQVEKRAYVGCPKCMKKLDAAPNTTVECPRDGLVRAQVLEWNLVLAGDSTGEIMLTIPPSIGRVPNAGEVIAVEGVLTEQEEFFVYRFSSVEVKPAAVEIPAVTVAVTAPPVSTVTTAPPTPTEPTVTITAPPAALKCPECGREFKNKQALGVHIKLAHKKTLAEAQAVTKPVEAKPVEVPTPVEVPKPAEVKPAEVKPTLPDEAVKYARVAGTINKPFEEFKVWILGKFPDINIDELFKAAGVIVEGGVLKRSS
jgi:hypothetical protein